MNSELKVGQRVKIVEPKRKLYKGFAFMKHLNKIGTIEGVNSVNKSTDPYLLKWQQLKIDVFYVVLLDRSNIHVSVPEEALEVLPQ